MRLRADVFRGSDDPAGRTHTAYEGIQADPFADVDRADLERYFNDWHSTVSDLQDVYYSRFYRKPVTSPMWRDEDSTNRFRLF